MEPDNKYKMMLTTYSVIPPKYNPLEKKGFTRQPEHTEWGMKNVIAL